MRASKFSPIRAARLRFLTLLTTVLSSLALVSTGAVTERVAPGMTVGPETPDTLPTVKPPDEPLSASAFADPPVWARPQAYWLSEGNLDLEESVRQMELFRAAGIGGITYEFGAGGGNALAGPYVPAHQDGVHLSDEWFAYMDGLLTALDERGMHMHLLDVPFTPSGSAAGRVSEPAHGGDSELGWTTLVEAVPGQLYEPVTRPYWLDPLDAVAVQRYIDVLYAPHEEHLGHHFGGALQALWSDEVAMHPTAAEPTVKAPHPRFPEIPWTDDLAEYFEQRYGYELTTDVIELVFASDPTRPDSRRAAHDYWEAVTARFAETYYGGLSNWATDRGVGFIGQLLGEEMTEQHWVTEGSYFRPAAQATVSSTDLITGNLDLAGTPWCDGESCYGMTQRLVASAAHLFDRGRVHIEFLDLDHTEVKERPAMLRAMVDHAFARGVNHIALHSYGFAGSEYSYENPLFEHQRLMNDYIGRLGYLFSPGRTLPDLAVGYAPETYWIGDVWDADAVSATSAILDSAHYAYDYVPVELFADPDLIIGDGTFTYGPQSFRGLVVADWASAKLEVVDRVAEFVERGGTLAVTGRHPAWELRGRDDELAAVTSALFGFDPAAPPTSLTTNAYGDGTVIWAPADDIYDDARNWDPARATELAPMVDALRQAVPPRVVVEGDRSLPSTLSATEVLPYRRADSDLYLVTNFPDWRDKVVFQPGAHRWAFEGERAEVVLDVPATGLPELWDAVSGAVTPISTYEVAGDRIRIPLTLDAFGSAVVRLRPGDPAAATHITDTNLVGAELTSTGGVVGYVPEDGLTGEAFAEVRAGTQTWRVSGDAPAVDVTDLADVLYTLTWTDGSGTVQRYQGSWYDTQVDPLVLPRTPWYLGGGRYEASVDLGDAVADARVILDLGAVGDLGVLTLNGVEVGTRAFPPYAWDITSVLRPGPDAVALQVEASRANAFPNDGLWPSGLLGPAEVRVEPRVHLTR